MSLFSINDSAIFNALGGGSPLSIINSVLHPSYAILNSGTQDNALDFDGVVSIQAAAGADIINAPIEKGKYQAFNKITRPAKLTAQIVVTGLTGYSGSIPNILQLNTTSQTYVLDSIRYMINTPQLYDIETPKETFTSYDAIGFDYQVTSQHGVTMLVIGLYFQQVLVQQEVRLSKQSAKDQPTNNDVTQGASASTKNTQASSNPARLEDLKTMWYQIGQDTRAAVGDTDITTSFTSSTTTASQTLSQAGQNISNKTDNLVSNISRSLT